MTRNMGTADRSLRILAAVLIAVLYFTGTISGIAAVVLGVIALVFLVTGAVGFCPGYVPLGISTSKNRSRSVGV